jgi:hypothetical protein
MRETLAKVKVRIKHTCVRCRQNKLAKDFYTSRRNKSGLEGICKQCKRIKSAAKRFQVSEDTIEHLYTFSQCMCCGVSFKDSKLTHIHHTQAYGLRGIVCFSCNYILAEETDEDKTRIQKCLEFIDRNNLSHTVNPQERPISKDAVAESSETTSCKTFYCKQCQRQNLTQNDFHKQKSRRPRRVCRDCWNSNWRLRNKFKSLRITKTHCDCCNTRFTKRNKSCVHHIDKTVHGIICNRCNQILGDESIQRKNQLLACLEFMI